MRKQHWKQMISGFLAAMVLGSCAAASGAELTELQPVLTAPEEVALEEDPSNPGTYVGRFQLELCADRDFASTEYGLTCGSAQVQLSAAPASVGKVAGQAGPDVTVEYGFAQTVKRDTLYFGFFRGKNEFQRGTRYSVAEVTCTWTGTEKLPETVELGLELAKLNYFDTNGVLHTENLARDGISIRLVKPGSAANFTSVSRSGTSVHCQVTAEQEVQLLAGRYEDGQLREIRSAALTAGETVTELQFCAVGGEVRLFLLDKTTWIPLSCVKKLNEN